MARPREEISPDILINLIQIQCTLEEICGVFGVSEDTIERRCKEYYNMRFADVIKSEAANGRMSLRRMQWKSAEAGNVTMQIWLGKQYLGQSDKNETEHSFKGQGLKIGFNDGGDAEPAKQG